MNNNNNNNAIYTDKAFDDSEECEQIDIDALADEVLDECDILEMDANAEEAVTVVNTITDVVKDVFSMFELEIDYKVESTENEHNITQFINCVSGFFRGKYLLCGGAI